MSFYAFPASLSLPFLPSPARALGVVSANRLVQVNAGDGIGCFHNLCRSLNNDLFPVYTSAT